MNSWDGGGVLYTLNNLVTLFPRSLGCVQYELLCFDWCFREYCESFVDLTFLIMFANILILFSLCFYVFEIFVVMTRFKNLQFVCFFLLGPLRVTSQNQSLPTRMFWFMTQIFMLCFLLYSRLRLETHLGHNGETNVVCWWHFNRATFFAYTLLIIVEMAITFWAKWIFLSHHKVMD